MLSVTEIFMIGDQTRGEVVSLSQRHTAEWTGQSWCACKLPGLGGLWSWEVEKGSVVALCLS